MHNKILALPDQTTIFPGHDYKDMNSSTLEEEKNHNPRILIKEKNDFIHHMNNLKLVDPKMMDVAVPANLKLGL